LVTLKIIVSELRQCIRENQKLTRDIAPIFKDVEISYQKVWYNGSFLKANIFRQDAGPEVDAAWKSLGADCKLSRLSTQYFVKLTSMLTFTNR